MTILNLSPTMLIVCFLPALINLFAIYHAFRHDFSTIQEKMIWVLAATILPVIGGLLYIIFGIRRIIKTTPPAV
jgi:hypothetical protein